jgi:uncharacterized protein (TIGR00251 family)
MKLENETRLIVHVQPNARQNKLVDFKEGVLYLKITAPPVEGKANYKLIDFLSDILGLSKNCIKIERGHLGRNKTITVIGVEREKLLKMLDNLIAHNT